MVCPVFCCRAGETSHESRIESLGFRLNVITTTKISETTFPVVMMSAHMTSTKIGRVNPLPAKSSDLLDATMKI